MGNISSLFPLPVYLDKPEGETFEKIQEELLSLCEKTDFSQKGNWNKDTHMLSKDPFKTNILLDNNCTNVVDFIYKSATNYIEGITGHGNYQYNLMESWLTKTMNGQYAHDHHHGAADISGVYYIKTNGKDGNLRFDNIHSSMAGNFICSTLPSRQPMPLETGGLILWPGPLRHGTETNTTDSERISLSFNIFVGRKGFIVDNG